MEDPQQSGPAVSVPVGDRTARAIRSAQLDAALEAVCGGYSVFPLLEGEKTPARARGCLAACGDWKLIRETWARHPDLNYGIATGPISELVILDVDVDPDKGTDGPSALNAVEDVHGPLPPTFTVQTPRGGLHLYFRLEPGFSVPNSTSDDGLDVRGEGGYVVGPGSVVGGRPYVVVRDLPVAWAPDWLLARMLSGSPRRWDPAASFVVARPSSSSSSSSRCTSTAPEDDRQDAGCRPPIPRPTRTGVHCARGGSKTGANRAYDNGMTPAGKIGPGSETETEPGDRLADPVAIAKVLEVLGRPGVAFNGTGTEKFRCPIPGHTDDRPSGDLFRGRDGRWLYCCRTACGVTLTMAELYATVTAGKLVKLGGKKPSIAVWLWRMWHEAGIDPVVVDRAPLKKLKAAGINLTNAELAYADGLLLLLALRRHHGDLDYLPFTHPFAVDWCAISLSTARRAARKVKDCGWLRVKESPPGMPCGLLYDLGPVVPQDDPNPFATTIPWAVFRDDGTRERLGPCAAR